MINKFDNSHGPVLRLNLENDLTDASGQAMHLTGASPVFRVLWPGLIGLASGSASRAAGTVAPLMLYGDKTIEAILVMRSTPTNGVVAVLSGPGGSELEINNAVFQVNLVSQNSAVCFSEHGAGADEAFTATVPTRGLPALGVPFHFCARWKNGVRAILIDGSLFAVSVDAELPPTGGSNASFGLRNGGTNPPEVAAFKITPSALSFAEILVSRNHAMGDDFAPVTETVVSLWSGALTEDGVTVVAQLSHDSDDVRLVAEDSAGTFYSSSASTEDTRVIKLTIDGLSPDTEYTYRIESNGVLIEGPTGHFRTLPAAGPASFTIAFSGDAWNGSNHEVYDTIRLMQPTLFQHLGDIFYPNITTNNQALYHAAYDLLLAQPRVNAFFASVPVDYAWDDHCFADNNSNASAASRPAACAVYRQRVPHYPLPDVNGAIYHSYVVGRVLVIVTDQRSAASPNSATDNASKTMLGSAQKAWFKDLVQNSPGMFIVWVCPRMFCAPAFAGADHWGGFTAERAELVGEFHTHASGRWGVWSADIHELGIGVFDFLPGGGEPAPVFQAAPLDVVPAPSGVTYSVGGPFTTIGQFGTMTVVDTGGPTIDVTWTGYDASGTVLVSNNFTVAL